MKKNSELANSVLNDVLELDRRDQRVKQRHLEVLVRDSILDSLKRMDEFNFDIRERAYPLLEAFDEEQYDEYEKILNSMGFILGKRRDANIVSFDTNTVTIAVEILNEIKKELIRFIENETKFAEEKCETFFSLVEHKKYEYKVLRNKNGIITCVKIFVEMPVFLKDISLYSQKIITKQLEDNNFLNLFIRDFTNDDLEYSIWEVTIK